MLIGRLISDNPRLAQAAVRAHQEGRLLSGTYLIDIDALAANAAMLRDAAAAAGLTVYFMAKQFGRNPDACRAAVGAGLDRAVAVDPQCLEAEVRHGIRIGHAGHLVQPHRGAERAVIDGEQASEIAGRPMTAADAFAATEPRLQRLVDEAVAEFGQQLASFATLLDPERIVIGGGLVNAAERLLGPLQAALAKIAPFPAEIVPSAFTDAALLGAAALAFGAATLPSGTAGDRLCAAT
jgi:predicted NBD/HSP70 family sugar kinase